MEPLDEKTINDQLKSNLKGWIHDGGKLKREFEFDDFREALAFIVRIGFEAEEQKHHPELMNVFNRVKISLATHDAGNSVTEKDIRLAKSIDQVFSRI
ncbi:MAG: 4a-hydroxytetrahydrobiopterin dehydratase [Balneolaceae bacterium]